MFIFENAHQEPTIVSDPRTIRVHLELNICNLRLNVNNSELTWDIEQSNKVFKFTNIQNITELGRPVNPDLKFLEFCFGRKVEWENSSNFNKDMKRLVTIEISVSYLLNFTF
ncbi:hypothetical protein AVEN_147423-1 [Araneus ventricosus]|uniref:Uncharacterized protein n=1 Tax=Araneus ventricosus TaxID=182803 RepID=A0A4Y2DND7_ARAVE|nr:hypothetical protein AVEN_147423-1 [Araneus ventricosus]